MITNHITYTRPDLNTEYDYVGIIDGLTDFDRNRFKITTELKAMLLKEGLTVATALVHTGDQLLNALDIFCKEAISGKRFMLHFVSHGNELGISSGADFLNWHTLRPYLQRINLATKETLLINMSTCKGLHGIKIVDDDSDYPFFALIGANENLLVKDAIAANKIMYKKWLNDKPVQELVPETNKELGKDILFNISSEGYRIITSLKSSH